eukprot:4743787-Amphidinium_carterae.1
MEPRTVESHNCRAPCQNLVQSATMACDEVVMVLDEDAAAPESLVNQCTPVQEALVTVLKRLHERLELEAKVERVFRSTAFIQE